MRPLTSAFLLVSALTLPLASPAQAQQPVATASVLDGVFSEAQATRGQRIYEVECSLCHGPREFSGPLFQLRWAGQRLGSLFMTIRMSMPLDNPGRLSEQQYADVVAYMLQLNGYPAGKNELTAVPDSLHRILIERANGSRP